MMGLQLLVFVCWCSSIFAVTSCFRVDGYSCVSAYWKSITCVLNITSNPAGPPNTNYSLKFVDAKNKTNETTCPLVLMNNTYRCVCKMNREYLFGHYTKISIQLCNESSCLCLMESFEPTKNIKMTPPRDVEVNDISEHVNITWKSGYENHAFFKNFDYDLLLQKSHSSWSQTLKPRQTFELIRKSSFDTDATYCFKVRAKPLDGRYSGTWSEWSPTACWKNDAQIEQLSLLVILTRSLGPVCVIVGVALFLFYSPAARMKIKTLSHTPSPAPFFQPLFQRHEGNLQEWLAPRGKFTPTHKAEEILVTSAVTLVPKPITKDPAENQDFLNPSAPQLVLSQCPSSYVGLPGMHEALQPVAMVCPKDTSYTQLPCSIWGFGNGEVQVAPCPPLTVLEISRTDSGCSCEDLTQSQGCSLPSSPITESSPPPCFCNDYCILNKTAEGVVPVLVSGLNMFPDITSDSQQAYESQKNIK